MTDVHGAAPRTVEAHFWLPDEPGGYVSWDPDEDPQRYPSGLGHGLLELHKRLQARDHPVTIGPRAVAPRPLVLHLETLWDWDHARPDVGVWARAARAARGAPTITVIRGDVPLQFRPSLGRAVSVMPNQSSVARARETWLPLLPQRGLIPRDQGRRGQVRSLAVLAFSENVPEFVTGAAFLEQLDELGVELIRHEFNRGSEAPRWHDLSNVDTVLCVRRDPLGSGFARKPPTKLINAWVAGAIPLVSGREPAYTELARPGEDVLVVESAHDVINALRLLKETSVVQRLEAGARERGLVYSRDRILDRWEGLLARPRDRRPSWDDPVLLAEVARTAAGLTTLSGLRRMRRRIRTYAR